MSHEKSHASNLIGTVHVVQHPERLSQQNQEMARSMPDPSQYAGNNTNIILFKMPIIVNRGSLLELQIFMNKVVSHSKSLLP